MGLFNLPVRIYLYSSWLLFNLFPILALLPPGDLASSLWKFYHCLVYSYSRFHVSWENVSITIFCQSSPFIIIICTKMYNKYVCNMHNTLIYPKQRTTFYEKNCQYAGLWVYNNLLNNVKSIESFSAFRKSLLYFFKKHCFY